MHQVHVVHPHLKLLHIQMTKLPNQLCLCGWFDLVISEFSFRMSPFSFFSSFPAAAIQQTALNVSVCLSFFFYNLLFLTLTFGDFL